MIRLLQIEDDPKDVVLLREAIRECSMDVDVRVAPDGMAGLECLRLRQPPLANWRPNLVICDIHMPKMDGHTFLLEVKSDPELRGIPIIMLSTSRAAEDVLRAYDRHANCFLQKPGSFVELCVLTRRLAEFWFAAAALPSPKATVC